MTTTQYSETGSAQQCHRRRRGWPLEPGWNPPPGHPDPHQPVMPGDPSPLRPFWPFGPFYPFRPRRPDCPPCPRRRDYGPTN